MDLSFSVTVIVFRWESSRQRAAFRPACIYEE